MKIRPLQDRIIVQRVEEESKTKGGIIIPDTAAEKPQTGKVVSVGPGIVGEDGKVQPLDVKAGDRVTKGQVVGRRPLADGKPALGAPVHASIDGTVVQIIYHPPVAEWESRHGRLI